MRACELLIEGQIGRIIVGPPDNQQLIVVGDHAMDQTINRMVLPTDVDRVLKKLHTVSDKISQFETGHKFWVYDPDLDVALGFRSVQPGVKYKLNTVVGDRPYDGETPVVALNEVRSDDDPKNNYYDADEGFEELKVSERIQKYFTDRGYRYLGEGRDQMAFLTPRETVLKILGIGEDQREDVVKTYVGFFMRNQRNPHYPRIYNAGDFTVDGESYFLYEMEYLNPVHGEERVLDYIEELMSAVSRGEHALNAFYNNTPRPPELGEQQVDGLVYATQDLEDAIGGQAGLDLRAIENLGRRDDGQIVIIDPFSL